LNNKAYENAFLIRHAKSDWPINVPDFDRPLNERGKKNAPKMAKFLKILV
jgi:phosphohistidine phosphatase